MRKLGYAAHFLFCLLVFPELSNADWKSVVVEDPLEKTKSVNAIYYDGNSVEVARLMCAEYNTLRIFIQSKEFINTSNEGVTARHRFDEDKVQELTWMTTSSEDSITNSLLGFNPIPFARNLSQKSSLYIRVFDFKGGAHDLQIPLEGASDAVNAVLTECSVTFEPPKADGVSEEIIQIVDEYGPLFTKCAKKYLASQSEYSGQLTPDKDESFVRSVNKTLRSASEACRKSHSSSAASYCAYGRVHYDAVIKGAREQSVGTESCNGIGVRS